MLEAISDSEIDKKETSFLKDRLRYYLDSYGRDDRGASTYSIKAFLSMPSVPERVKKEVKEIARKLIMAGLKNDANLADAYSYSDEIGEYDEIIARMKQGVYSHGQTYFDLMQAALRWGDENDIRRAIIAWKTRCKYDAHSMNMDLDFSPITEIVDKINNAVRNYASDFDLYYTGTGSPTINAAVEIKKQEYDLAVGIQKGCSNLTTILEMLGQPSSNIRFSQRWEKRKPYWMKVGRDGGKIQSAKRIIVCENDVSSGKTLQAVQPYLEKLNPESVDICFTGLHQEKSIEKAKTMGFYTHVFSTMTVGFEDYLANLKTAEAAVTRLGY